MTCFVENVGKVAIADAWFSWFGAPSPPPTCLEVWFCMVVPCSMVRLDSTVVLRPVVVVVLSSSSSCVCFQFPTSRHTHVLLTTVPDSTVVRYYSSTVYGKSIVVLVVLLDGYSIFVVQIMNAKRHIHGGLSRMLSTLLRSQSFVALALIAALSVYTSSALAFSFACPRNNQHQKIVLRKMATNDNHNEASTAPCFQMNHLAAHPSTLPGDPSLVLFTNMDLKEKKMEVMKG